MPIRVPNNNEHAELVRTFRLSLKEDAPETIVDRILPLEACVCLDEQTRADVTGRISEKFAIQNASYAVVGSAQIGFSLIKKGGLPRYRAFNSDSDIDVAIISSDFFDQVWEQVFTHFIENHPWPALQDFQKYFFRGWIRPDKIPYNMGIRTDWFDFFRQLSRDLFDSEHNITCALYKNDRFIKEYQKKAIRECAVDEAIQ